MLSQLQISWLILLNMIMIRRFGALAELFLTRISAISLSTLVNSVLNKGMKTISECLQHVKTIADSLSAIDHKVSNPHLVTNTLNGLGPEYRQ